MYRIPLSMLLVASLCACGTDTGTGKADSRGLVLKDSGAPADKGEATDAAVKKDTGSSCGKSSYPCGPFGTKPGSVIQDHTFMVFRDPRALCKETKDHKMDTSKSVPMSLKDFYQWDSSCLSKKKKLLWILGSAAWCGICTKEIKAVKAAILAGQIDNRVAFLNLVVDGKTYGKPADVATAKLWVTGFGLNHPVASDMTYAFKKYFLSSGFPLNILVDLETMKIYHARNGDNLAFMGKKMAEFFSK